jgi:hypothetical protein
MRVRKERHEERVIAKRCFVVARESAKKSLSSGVRRRREGRSARVYSETQSHDIS